MPRERQTPEQQAQEQQSMVTPDEQKLEAPAQEQVSGESGLSSVSTPGLLRLIEMAREKPEAWGSMLRRAFEQLCKRVGPERARALVEEKPSAPSAQGTGTDQQQAEDSGAQGPDAAKAVDGGSGSKQAKPEKEQSSETSRPAEDRKGLNRELFLVSNNPEQVWKEGYLAQSGRAVEGKLGLYIHHQNLTGRNLRFVLRLRQAQQQGSEGTAAPDEAKAAQVSQVGISGASNTGRVTTDRDADPNRRTVREFLKQPVSSSLSVSNEAEHTIGSLGAYHGSLPENSPMIDARLQLDIKGGPCFVEVWAVEDKGSGARHNQGHAWGNTKWADPGTQGRAAGLYEGAGVAQSHAIKLSEVSQKELQLDAVTPVLGGRSGAAPTSERLDESSTRQAKVPTSTEELMELIEPHIEKPAERVLSYLLEQVWGIDRRWLAQAHPDASFNTLIPELRRRIELYIERRKAEKEAAKGEDSAATQQTRQERGKALEGLLDFMASRSGVGSQYVAGSYGLSFDLDFMLDNDMDSPGQATISFFNKVGIYNGYFEVNGAGIAHFMRAGQTLQLWQERMEKGTQASVSLHFMIPGQTSAGQAIRIRAKKLPSSEQGRG